MGYLASSDTVQCEVGELEWIWTQGEEGLASENLRCRMQIVIAAVGFQFALAWTRAGMEHWLVNTPRNLDFHLTSRIIFLSIVPSLFRSFYEFLQGMPIKQWYWASSSNSSYTFVSKIRSKVQDERLPCQNWSTQSKSREVGCPFDVSFSRRYVQKKTWYQSRTAVVPTQACQGKESQIQAPLTPDYASSGCAYQGSRQVSGCSGLLSVGQLRLTLLTQRPSDITA